MTEGSLWKGKVKVNSFTKIMIDYFIGKSCMWAIRYTRLGTHFAKYIDCYIFALLATKA
jgi:hypothetical protein